MKRIVALILVAVMLLSILTGCDSADYKTATELYAGGNYAEAAQMFESLGDYKDSADQARICRYAYAKELFQAGEFTQAAEVFAMLGDYQDSAAMIKECGYRNAEVLLSAGSYAEAIAAYEALGNYKDSADRIAAAKRELMYITYPDVIAALSEGVWFCESSDANAVKILTFTRENATVGGVYYDGNGAHESDAEVCAYAVDDAAITVAAKDGELTIPYTMEAGEIVLEPGVYFTPAQVEEALQGYWGLYSTYYFYAAEKDHYDEYIYCFDNGTFTYEYAKKAYLSNGYYYHGGRGYYYFGPYQGTYKITEKGLEVDVNNGHWFGFLISGGKVVMTRFSGILERYDGFKGPRGYKLPHPN